MTRSKEGPCIPTVKGPGRRATSLCYMPVKTLSQRVPGCVVRTTATRPTSQELSGLASVPAHQTRRSPPKPAKDVQERLEQLLGKVWVSLQ